MKKEGVDFGLVLHVQEKWWISWPSIPSLSYCYGSMVYGFGSIWSNLGYTAHCFGAVRVLARQLWSSSKCLMWCLWRERNSRCFEDIERSIPDFKLFFFRTLIDWLFALQKQSFPSFIDFLDSCNFCIWFLDHLYTP